MTHRDRELFERRVRAHHAAVYRSALRILRRPEDAEDITQRVFLELLQRKATLTGAADPQRVLCWRASRLALNELRSRRNRIRREERNAMDPTDAAPSPDPADREEREAVVRCLDRLPDETRLPLTLRYREGMTFAAVGEALDISESTAHQRVQRGLARLRELLRRSGFAAAALRLPDLLTSPEPVVVPPHLEAKLLTLTPRAATGLLSGKGLAVATAVVLGGTAVLAAGLSGNDAAEGTPPAATERAVAREGEPPAAAATSEPTPAGTRRTGVQDPGPDPAGTTTATFTGTVATTTGQPLPGALVRATSLEHAGKAPRFHAETHTTAGGAFELTVPVLTRRGQGYHLLARKDGYAPQRTGALRVQTGEEHRVAPLRLRPRPDATPGEHLLGVLVMDDAGRPLEGIPVHLHRATDRPPTGHAPPEARARTDDTGHAVLAAPSTGPGVVRIDGRDRGLRFRQETLTLDDRPYRELAVQLERGREIRGRAVRVDGRPIAPRHTEIRAHDPDLGIHHLCKIAGDGSFVLRGLDDGPYVLVGSGRGLSPFHREGVRAGTHDLTVPFKAHDDPRDVGWHDAEIHGRVVDAGTGEGVALAWWQLDHYEVGDVEGIPHELLADRIARRSVQLSLLGEPPPPAADFHVTGLEPGRYVLVVEDPDHALSWAGPIDVGHDRIASGIELRLHRGGTVSGIVRDPTGQPVADALVFPVGPGERGRRKLRDADAAIAESDGRTGIHLSLEVRTDRNGRYTLERVGAGVELGIAVCHPDFAPAVSPPLTLREGARGTRDLVLQPR